MFPFFVILYIIFLYACALFGLQISKMLKRWSSTFKKTKSNGAVKQNGVSESPGLETRKSTPNSKKNDKHTRGHSTDRNEVESTFEQYAQLIHAARRPLPTQSGDGSYLEHDVPTGLMQDLKALGFKDVNTLISVMKNKQSGGFVDDKTYLMERVIQVR
jgi:linoleate 10R-lipoxygenase